MIEFGGTVATASLEVERALAALRTRWPGTARTALILGTGSGQLAHEIEAEAIVPYADIPHMPRSTALAHKGQFVCGTLAGTPVIAMQGRCHLYEGYSFDEVTLGVRLMRAAGAEQLIASNAAGAVNPQYATGDVMVIADHINLMWQHARDEFPRMATFYDPALIDQAAAIARRENFVLQQGVYVGVSGPNYETRAEYRCFRRIGGDVVGMSTVPEAIVAGACGMRAMALSLVTNVARPDAPDRVDAEDVVTCAAAAEPKLRAIIHGVIAACGLATH